MDSILTADKIKRVTALVNNMARKKGIRDIDDIEDLTQDVLLSIVKAENSGRLPAGEGADKYISTIIRHCIDDYHRRPHLRPGGIYNPIPAGELPDTHNSIDDNLVTVTLDQLAERLTPSEQRIFAKLREGLPHKVIARELGMTTNTVRKEASAIVLKLRGDLLLH
mgnify:CR=1 FL=1